MSNYAPDPRAEKVYDNLQNKTLADVTAEDIQKLTNPTFIQATNQDALLTYNTINKAAMRDGSPIPSTAKFVSVTVTDTDKETLFQPKIGELWMLQGIGAVVSGGSGTRTFAAYLYDGTTELNWLSVSTSGGNLTFTGEGEYPDVPLYFDHNMFVRVQSTGSFTTIKYNMAVIRVR